MVTRNLIIIFGSIDYLINNRDLLKNVLAVNCILIMHMKRFISALIRILVNEIKLENMSSLEYLIIFAKIQG